MTWISSLPESIAPIQELKVRYLGSTNPRLHTDEVLIALSTCAATDQNAKEGPGTASQTQRLPGPHLGPLIGCGYQYL